MAYRESLQPNIKIENKRVCYEKMIGGRRLFAAITFSIESLAINNNDSSSNGNNNGNNNSNSDSNSNNRTDRVSQDKFIQLCPSQSSTNNNNNSNNSNSNNNNSTENRNVDIYLHKDISQILNGEEYSSLCEGVQACLNRGPKG